MQFSTTIGAAYERLIRQLASFKGALPAAGVIAVVEVMLVIACAWQGAALLWLALVPSTLGPVPVPARSSAGFVPRMPHAVTMSTVDLFYRGDAAVSAAIASGEPPTTTLALELMGVRANGDPGRSSAIIQRPDKSQDVFKVGQEIVEGAVLDAVYGDRVTIRRNGARETLPIDKARVLNQAHVAGAIQVDLASLSDAVQIIVGEDGRPVLMPAGNGALFAQAGFAAGDVLVSVNGRSVQDPADLLSAIAASRSAGLAIETERQGQRHTVRLMARR